MYLDYWGGGEVCPVHVEEGKIILLKATCSMVSAFISSYADKNRLALGTEEGLNIMELNKDSKYLTLYHRFRLDIHVHLINSPAIRIF